MSEFTTGCSDTPPDLLYTLTKKQSRIRVIQAFGFLVETAGNPTNAPWKAIDGKEAVPHQPETKAFRQ